MASLLYKYLSHDFSLNFCVHFIVLDVCEHVLILLYYYFLLYIIVSMSSGVSRLALRSSS